MPVLMGRGGYWVRLSARRVHVTVCCGEGGEGLVARALGANGLGLVGRELAKVWGGYVSVRRACVLGAVRWQGHRAA